MKHLALAIVLLLSCAAFAQTTTTFSGTISDLTGTPVTSGQVTFDLKPSVDSTISGVARFTPQTVTCGIDGTGALKNQALSGACVVTNNTALTPSGTSYKVTLCPNFACTSSFVTYATGGTVNITTVVPTPATSPVYNLVDTLNDQTIAGNKTFTNQVVSPTLKSTVATGTAPLTVASTTPVTNLTVANHPTVYLAGAQTASVKEYRTTVTLAAGTVTHTFGNSFAFTNTSYTCQVSDTATTPAAASYQVVSTTQVTVKGTGADAISLSCKGI